MQTATTQSPLAMVRDIVADCRPLRNLSTIQREDDLFDDIGLDSLDRVTVALALEATLHTAIPDDAILRWRTVGDIADWVGARL